MPGLTLEQDAAYQQVLQMQADNLGYFRPGSAYALLAYAIVSVVVGWVAWKVATKNEWTRIGWLIWIAMVWAIFIPASYSAPNQQASWVHEQLDRLANLPATITRETDDRFHTGFFDPTTGFVRPDAFPLRNTAERVFKARVPDALHDNLWHFFGGGSPRPCASREMVTTTGLTQTNLQKRQVDLPGSTGPTTTNCWDLHNDIQAGINTYAQGKFGYEVRSAVRRSVITATAASTNRSPLALSEEPIDSPVWQWSLRIRLWLTSKDTLGKFQGFVLSATALAVPYVMLVVFIPKVGWWGLLEYFGVLFAARFTTVLYYLVHVILDKPAFANLTDTDPDVSLNHILDTRIGEYAATDSTFFETLDNDLWMDTLGAVVCHGVLAAVLLRLVLKAALPLFRRS